MLKKYLECSFSLKTKMCIIPTMVALVLNISYWQSGKFWTVCIIPEHFRQCKNDNFKTVIFLTMPGQSRP